MGWQHSPYFIPLLIAGFVGLINALVIARRRRVNGSLPLLGMMLAVSGWAFAYALELASPEQPWQVFWSKVEYLGIVCVPVVFLDFVLEYARNTKSRPSRWLWLLWLVPLATLGLVWSNELHGLIWSRIGQKMVGGSSMLSLDHGLAFWVWTVYSYVLMFWGSLVLIRTAISNPPELRPQALILILGAAVTWAGNAIYLLHLSPLPDLDLTPISFIFSMLLYSVGLFRFGILDLLPIAGETILESLDDVVIVLDEFGRVAYANKSYDYYTGESPRSVIGRPASQALAAWSGLQRIMDAQSTLRGETVLNIEGRPPVYFDVRVSAIREYDKHLGRALILSDVSERRSAEKRISLIGQADGPILPDESLPIIFVFHVFDEKIVEVNRRFVLTFGFDRKKVVGRSLLQLDIWDPYQRADFLRSFGSAGFLKNYPIFLQGSDGLKRCYVVSAHRVEIRSDTYIAVLAQPEEERVPIIKA